MSVAGDTVADHASTRRWTALLAVVDAVLWVDIALLLFFRYRTAAALLAYPALSLAAVIALYAGAARGGNPAAYLKGERAAWLQCVFLPYRAVAWCVTVLGRIARYRHEPVSEVAPGVYVGVRLFHPEASRLRALGVHRVLDLCAELPTNLHLLRAPFERMQLPVLDRCAPLPDELDRATAWVAAQRAAGHSVYIHCAFGRGRSAMVAAAVLLRLGLARTVDEAIAQLSARRSVSIKGAQLAALGRFAERLRERARAAVDDRAPLRA